jgi:hypothetical protein
VRRRREELAGVGGSDGAGGAGGDGSVLDTLLRFSVSRAAAGGGALPDQAIAAVLRDIVVAGVGSTADTIATTLVRCVPLPPAAAPLAASKLSFKTFIQNFHSKLSFKQKARHRALTAPCSAAPPPLQSRAGAGGVRRGGAGGARRGGRGRGRGRGLMERGERQGGTRPPQDAERQGGLGAHVLRRAFRRGHVVSRARVQPVPRMLTAARAPAGAANERLRVPDLPRCDHGRRAGPHLPGRKARSGSGARRRAHPAWRGRRYVPGAARR